MNQSDFIVMFMSCLYRRNIIGYENLDDHILQTAKRFREKKELLSTWNCDTFTTSHGIYDLKDDHKMAPLLNEFKIQIDHVSRTFYGFRNPDIIQQNCWLNLALLGEYQEYHLHEFSDFSLVYYPIVDENTGAIVFRDSTEKRMTPISPKTHSDANNTTWKYNPIRHDLIIFRSYQEHMVLKNKSNSPRVSISANFTVTERQ